MSLAEAKALLDAEQYPEAGALITSALNADPDNNEWLFLYARAMAEAERPAFARLALEHLTRGEGRKRFQVWLNLGKAYADLGWYDKADGCFRKVLQMAPDNPQAIRNISTVAVKRRAWAKAEEYAHRGMSIGADAAQPHLGLAHAYLNTQRYGAGWDEYAHGIGCQQWRKRRIYAGEPQWAGEASNVVITGEQGIGDQIAYLSCLRDAERNTGATFTAIDCNPKMRGLFARTFPEIPVYGDMFKDEIDWEPRPLIDHSALMSLLPCYSRREASDYPSVPYLKTCPIRTAGWREHLGALPGKKIGLAWTGGIEQTGQHARSTTFDTFAPLTELPATFISLEYRDPGELPIAHYPWATESSDYDDTAALVANLDLVICVPTSVAHLAGALGVPAWVIQHDDAHFFFADDCLLWDSVSNYQRRNGWSVIEKVAGDLGRFLAD